MGDKKFIELIFEPERQRYGFAYQSLAKHPMQLFAIFIKKDVSTEFFSAFPIYGKRLAGLLRNVHEYFGPASKHHIQLQKDDWQLFEEILAAFLFNFLPLQFQDNPSQESVAEIVMAVIHISSAGGRLELLGAELGRTTGILTRLIADGYMRDLPRKDPHQSFRSLTSNNLKSWVPVAQNLVRLCEAHREQFTRFEDWSLMEIIQSFPCQLCPPVPYNVPTNIAPRANPQAVTFDTKVFSKLLGEHMGTWKIVVSEQALKNLKRAAKQGMG
jgi:hypothetical protein